MDVEISIKVQGNRTRAEVMRFLDTVTSAPRRVIARETGISEGTLARILKELEDYGCITVDPSTETSSDQGRSGHSFLYVRDHVRMVELNLAFHNYTTPTRPHTLEQQIEYELEGSPAGIGARVLEAKLAELRAQSKNESPTA